MSVQLNPIHAQKLQAKIVTLSNDYTQALSFEIVDVTGSADATTIAHALDAGTDTHSAVLEYYVTIVGAPEGYIQTYVAAYFKKIIEPVLILEIPTA